MHPLTPHVGSMSMIDIDASAIIQLVIVLLTFFVLRSLVFGPLLQSIGARAAKTEQARADALAITARAKSLGEKYDAEMRQHGQKRNQEKNSDNPRKFLSHNFALEKIVKGGQTLINMLSGRLSFLFYTKVC